MVPQEHKIHSNVVGLHQLPTYVFVGCVGCMNRSKLHTPSSFLICCAEAHNFPAARHSKLLDTRPHQCSRQVLRLQISAAHTFEEAAFAPSLLASCKVMLAWGFSLVVCSHALYTNLALDPVFLFSTSISVKCQAGPSPCSTYDQDK